MTYLTDEQLDALEHDLNLCDSTSDYEVIAERFLREMSGRWLDAELELAKHLITALRAERAAHQATRTERDRLRWHMANIVAQCGHRHRSCQRCEFAFTAGREALGKDAARAGREEGE